jgi:hypothetical protein
MAESELHLEVERLNDEIEDWRDRYKKYFFHKTSFSKGFIRNIRIPRVLMKKPGN